MKTNLWMHLCIDMQRMFEEDTPWHVSWMAKVRDAVIEVADRYPERTIFTRFVPPASSSEMPGMWRDYYDKWPMMTTARLNPQTLDLISPLRELVPPARIFTKRTYSPWTDARLHAVLQNEGIGTL